MDLAGFLVALRGVDAAGGPGPGRHNFFRGGPLATYADETVRSIAALGAEIPGDAAMRVWEDAMARAGTRDPVWFHGDVATGNLLLRDGRLAAVIDFGTSGVGDPACDVVIAWTLLVGPEPRRVPRDARRRSRDLVARSRLGAVEGADLAGREPRGGRRCAAAYNRRTIDRVLADHAGQC